MGLPTQEYIPGSSISESQGIFWQQRGESEGLAHAMSKSSMNEQELQPTISPLKF